MTVDNIRIDSSLDAADGTTDGVASVEAESEEDAVHMVLTGSATVNTGILGDEFYDATYQYRSGGGAFRIGRAGEDWRLELEDLYDFPDSADYDYNDDYWPISVRLATDPTTTTDPKIDLDVDLDSKLDTAGIDKVMHYTPGYKGAAQVLTAAAEQKLNVVATGLEKNTKYKVSLKDTSKLDGIAMNAGSTAAYPSGAMDNDFVLVRPAAQPGPSPDSDSEIAFSAQSASQSDSFEQSRISAGGGEEIVAQDGVDVDVTTDADGKLVVGLRCRDFGGRTTVVVKKDDGQTVVASLKVPLDANGNNVADAAAQNRGPGGANKETDDNDGSPKLDGTEGDRLTRFEEYRGFMVKGSHVRTSVEKKTAFVSNQTGWTPAGGGDVFVYLRATGIEILEVTDKEYAATSYEINSFGRPGYAKAQRAVVVTRKDNLIFGGERVYGLTDGESPSGYTSVEIDIAFHQAGLQLAAPMTEGQTWAAGYQDPNSGIRSWVSGGRTKIGGEVIDYAEVVVSQTLAVAGNPPRELTAAKRVNNQTDDVIFVDGTFPFVRALLGNGELIKVTDETSGYINKLAKGIGRNDTVISLATRNVDPVIGGKKVYAKLGNEWISYTKTGNDVDGNITLEGVTRGEFGTVPPGGGYVAGAGVDCPSQVYGLERSYQGTQKHQFVAGEKLTIVTVFTGMARTQGVPHAAGAIAQLFSDVDPAIEKTIAHEIGHAFGHNDHIVGTIMDAVTRGSYLTPGQPANLITDFTAANLGRLNVR